MTQQRVYLVDLQVRSSSEPHRKIESLLEKNAFGVLGCNSNINHDFEREEAGREAIIDLRVHQNSCIIINFVI